LKKRARWAAECPPLRCSGRCNRRHRSRPQAVPLHGAGGPTWRAQSSGARGGRHLPGGASRYNGARRSVSGARREAARRGRAPVALRTEARGAVKALLETATEVAIALGCASVWGVRGVRGGLVRARAGGARRTCFGSRREILASVGEEIQITRP
jgi:hypothetical protein